MIFEILIWVCTTLKRERDIKKNWFVLSVEQYYLHYCYSQMVGKKIILKLITF